MTDFSTPMGAVISSDGLHRTHLWRRWGTGRSLLWCMLNPSTADWTVNDPTISRCTSFAQGWGYDAIHVVNLFTRRGTVPSEALAFQAWGELIVPDYWLQLEEAIVATDADRVICGWGVKGRHKNQDSNVLTWFRAAGVEPLCLGTNRNGTPVHPLYQLATATLRPVLP